MALDRSPRLVSPKDLGDEVRRQRAIAGLSVKQAAERLGVEVGVVERAESPGYGLMVRARKQILEQVAGCTIDGPFYRVRPLNGSA